MRALLLDIEGTTTPISFVFDVLFPYARKHFGDYLKENYASPDVRSDLEELKKQHAIDAEAGLKPPDLNRGELEYVYWLMDRNSKASPLKSLQGKIWQKGYAEGSLKSTVFADVRPAMERWREAGWQVNIFSSGSVLAQRLLFAHTNAGDLTPFINNYFDTSVGNKTEADSYREIADRLALPARAIRFVSDVPAELDAARDAGMQTCLCIRPGNAVQQPVDGHDAIYSFDDIQLSRNA